MTRALTTCTTFYWNYYSLAYTVYVNDAASHEVLEHFYAVTDDFGDLVRRSSFVPIQPLHEIDDRAYFAGRPWELEERTARFAQPPKTTVEVVANPEGSWAEAEIRVSTPGGQHHTDRIFDLNVGGQDPIYLSLRELQGIVTAAADLLNLQVKPRGRALPATRTARVTQ